MRATTSPDVGSDREAAGAWLIVALGVVSAVLALEHALTHPDPFTWWTIDLAAAAVLPGALMYAGYRLARTDFDPDELWSVTRWCFAGVVALALVGGWILLSQRSEGGALAEPLFMVLMLAVIGAIGGLAVGVRETSVAHSVIETREADATAEAVRREAEAGREATRARVRALDDPERWLLVECLATTPGDRIGLRELAESLHRRKTSDGSSGSVDGVLARLHHVHLPMLADEGLIEYDERRRAVAYDGEKLSNTWIE